MADVTRLMGDTTPARPAVRPCGSCPYRRDAPSGLWDVSEYAKLPAYDGTTGEQAAQGAFGVFMCHQQDGHVCAGWAGCHDMEENLALRVAGNLVDQDAIRSYVSPVPLFASGREAAEHGLRDVAAMSPRALRAAAKLLARQRRRRLADRTDDAAGGRW